MKLITWNESYSVHVEEIDAQHQWLTDIINTLYDEVSEGKGKRLLEIVIESLVQYTQKHFETEENLMLKFNYPGFIEHKNKHSDLSKKVVEWEQAFKNGDVTSAKEMLVFLKNWLINHEVDVDGPLGHYLNSKGVN